MFVLNVVFRTWNPMPKFSATSPKYGNPISNTGKLKHRLKLVGFHSQRIEIQYIYCMDTTRSTVVDKSTIQIWIEFEVHFLNRAISLPSMWQKHSTRCINNKTTHSDTQAYRQQYPPSKETPWGSLAPGGPPGSSREAHPALGPPRSPLARCPSSNCGRSPPTLPSLPPLRGPPIPPPLVPLRGATSRR